MVLVMRKRKPRQSKLVSRMDKSLSSYLDGPHKKGFLFSVGELMMVDKSFKELVLDFFYPEFPKLI